MIQGSTVNANGAGDAFVAGLIAAAAWDTCPLSLECACKLALLCALQRVDSSLRDAPVKASLAELVEQAQKI